ncbi:MAG: flavodoxin domain-containing protein [Erysipelotrichaceae bacterium]|nr:flavodoxin domain-containing protein [Erysipelotrichaceae bacterium]
MQIIIYGSEYGTTKKYAEEFGRLSNIEVLSFNQINHINDYDSIYYFGALYAGGVLGLKQTLRNLDISKNKKLIIVSVGLADIDDQTNRENIRRSIANQLDVEVFNKAKIFHLRGGIDYSKLKFKHKTMMALLYTKAKSIPEKDRNAEVRAMIATYNQVVDFVDFSKLESILNEIY